MKILFYRYNSICEPDVIEAFRELGHAVTEISEEIMRHNVSSKECLELVSGALSKEAFDLVFTINYFPVISEVCRAYHVYYVSWIVDSPVLELYSPTIKNEWNRIFIFDRKTYEELVPYNPDRIFYLPLAANISGKQKTIKAAGPELNKKFSSEVSFVGSLYTEKIDMLRLHGASDYLHGYLDAVVDMQMDIYGDYIVEKMLTDSVVKDFKAHFENFYPLPEGALCSDRLVMALYYLGYKITSRERCTIMKDISKLFKTDIYTASDTADIPELNNRGIAKTLTEMPLVFANTKINLNFTARCIRSGLSQRIWDVFACEGFLISNYQSELEDYFVPGEDLVVYSDRTEIPDLVGYYLEHEKERKEIAHNAFEKMQKYHNYTQRAEVMLQTVRNMSSLNEMSTLNDK